MANIWLSAESDFALALREPNLLSPNRKPIGSVKRKTFVGSLDDESFSTLYGLQPTYLLLNPNQELGVYPNPRPVWNSITQTGQFFYGQMLNQAGNDGLDSLGSNDHTWVIVFKYNGTGYLYNNSNESSGNRTIRFNISSSTNLQMLTGQSNGSWGAFDLTFPEALAVGRVYVLTLRVRSNLDGVRPLERSLVLDNHAVVAGTELSTSLDGAYVDAAGNWNIGVSNLPISLFAHWPVCLSDQTVYSLNRDVFRKLLEPANDAPYLFPVAGGGGVSGTGDLVGAGSEITGTGERTITGTGALEGQGAEVVGTAMRTITGTGALVGQGSDVAGTGETGGAHTGAGDLVAAGSEIVGVGERTVTGTGTLVAQGSAVAGVGERTVTGSGDLVGAGAEVSGSGAIGGITTGTGDLVGAGSEIVGTGLRTVTGSGALVAQGSAVTGTGERAVTGAGALVGSGSEIVGAGVGGDVTTGAGALVGQGSAVTGTGTRTITGVGELVAAGSIIVGSGLRTITGSGALVGAGSEVVGSSAHQFVAGNTHRTWLLSPRGREWSLSRSN